jgi:hypothetical protein
LYGTAEALSAAWESIAAGCAYERTKKLTPEWTLGPFAKYNVFWLVRTSITPQPQMTQAMGGNHYILR